LYIQQQEIHDLQSVLNPVQDIQLTPADAVKAFAKFLNMSEFDTLAQEPPHLNQVVNTTFIVEGFPNATNPVPVELKYLLLEDHQLTLVWDMVVDLLDNWYHAHLCAKTGKVLNLIDWVSDSAYKVYPFGVNDPNAGHRKLVVNPPHPIASPAGWHILGSKKNGSLHRDTVGNNVFAQENLEGGNNWVKNYRPDGSLSLVFDFPANLSAKPSTYLDAAVTNLFYWNNIIHDLFYVYGFDEVSGNFQEFNFERGGKEGDAVIANAQDGSGYNNANFATPPDGSKPRMRMYVWNVVNPWTDGDLESGIIIHEYCHGISIRLTGGPMNVGCLGFGESGYPFVYLLAEVYDFRIINSI
jgi:extracellular elastinolytic metalloproteinase